MTEIGDPAIKAAQSTDPTAALEVLFAANVGEQREAGGHIWALSHWVLGLLEAGARVVVSPTLAAELRRTGAFAPDDLREGDAETCGCDAILNVMGILPIDAGTREVDAGARAGQSVFLDIDPGYPQMWRELGLADVLSGHDRFATLGENIGWQECSIPDCGMEWIATPPPVCLREWTPCEAQGEAYTTVASWRNPYGTVEREGVAYGSRVHEFRKFIELPRLVDVEFELALDIHPAEVEDLQSLRSNGWRVVDPRQAAGTPQAYRDYIRGSRAELCIAQNMYVQTRSGWLSDRSVCYLAAGKPVVAQDTGFSARYPVDEGLIAFSTLEQAAEAVFEVERDYERHSRAARALAEEYFGAGKVLSQLLEQLELDVGRQAA